MKNDEETLKAAAPIYALDERATDVSFLVAGGKLTVTHKLKKPSFQQLNERYKRVKNEALTISKEETQSDYSETEANGWLWDEIAVAISGYDAGNNEGNGWLDVTPTIARAVPLPHKAAAVQRLYAVSAKVEIEGGEGGFKLFADPDVRVVFEVGPNPEPDYVFTHVLRRPSEADNSTYSGKRTVVREIRTPGGRNQNQNRRLRVFQYLGVDVELFDRLYIRSENCSVGGQGFGDNRAAFLEAIDPIHKQLAIQAIFDSLTAELGN